MLFCTLPFFLFFLAVFPAYWLLPWQRGRVWLLLAASFFFYACWNHWLALLITASTIADYCLARVMEESSGTRRRLLLLLSLIANLGLLGYFKYANFFLDSLEDALTACGWGVALPTLQVILPVGISFYTFEAINYIVDVYRGTMKASRSLPDFMLFILFFPHLVAGPIVRARQFLPLVARRKHWSWLRANVGVQLIVMGLVKKLAIADRMALYADPVFADPGAFGTAALWLAGIAYCIQVYGDFSGYTDIALGLAHLFGYHLAPNFNMPYLAPNITELWRRWHMSLSSWIRDYLFIPLGGSRGTRWQTYRNLIIVMVLCGLWHGAQWSFVVFGLIQGCYLIVHSMFREQCQKAPGLAAALRTLPGTALCVALTLTAWLISLVVFRAETLAGAGTMLTRMFTPAPGLGLTLASHGLWLTVAFVALCHWLGHEQRWQRLRQAAPVPVRGLGYAAAITAALVLAPLTSKAFIYFQF